MIVLAVHVPPWVSVPLAVVLVAWILWYWSRMGSAVVPESRRRIRRASVLVMLVGVPFFVQAISFLDPQTQPATWVTTWMLVMFCIVLIVVTAALDVLNTMRLLRDRDRWP